METRNINKTNRTRKPSRKRKKFRAGFVILPAAFLVIAGIVSITANGRTINEADISYMTAEPVTESMPESVPESMPSPADDQALFTPVETISPYADMTITYHFGSQTEVLDWNTIQYWISDDGKGNITVDENQAAVYVKLLARQYNTAYCTKKLKTSYGPTVTITRGHYGWMIDQKAEVAALMECIKSGESQTREPVYSQTANSHDGPDYGDTYVEMNLTAQHLYFYKNGKLLVETDFVSGDEARGWSTPAGAFPLTYKQKNVVLKGKNYATPVTYWMPFNGNIGMHDGYWRSSFGGTIYKKSGSHGCVNLPPAVAKLIFENIEKGMPVLCYHLEGTEGETTMDIGNAKEIETKAVETKPVETIAEMPSAELPVESESSPAAAVESPVGPGTESASPSTGPTYGSGITPETSAQSASGLENQIPEPVMSEVLSDGPGQ